MQRGSLGLNVVVLVLSLVLTAALLRNLHVFRNVPQVSSLRPALQSCYILAGFCMCLVYSLGDGFLLLTWKQFGYLFYPFIGIANAIQALIIFEIYIKFCATEDKIKLASVVLNSVVDLYKPEGVKMTRIIEKIMNAKLAMIGYCLLAAATASLPMYIFMNTYKSNIDLFNQHMDVVEFAPLIYSTILVTILSSLQSIPLIWVLREVKRRNAEADIQKSLQLLVNFNFGTVACMVIVYASPLRRISQETINFKPLLVFHGHFILLCYLMLFSLYKIVRGQRATVQKSIQKLGSSMDFSSNMESVAYEDLILFLEDSRGFKLMLQIARKNFNVENVLFFGAVSQWKKSFADSSPDKRLKDATDVFELFCTKDSRAELNLSSKTKNELTKIFQNAKSSPENLHSDIFDKAKMEVLSLMYAETFVEAKRTAEYKAFCKNLFLNRQTSNEKLLSIT